MQKTYNRALVAIAAFDTYKPLRGRLCLKKVTWWLTISTK